MVDIEAARDDLLAFSGYIDREGLPPSVRAFQAATSVGSASGAQYRLKRLAALGWITRRSEGESRVWRMTERGRKEAK